MPRLSTLVVMALLAYGCGRIGFEREELGLDGGVADAGSTDAGLADAGLPDAGSCRGAASNLCEALPALPAPAVIDGVLDCGPPLVDLTPVGWTSREPIPEGVVARYAVAWRPAGLYFYVEVDHPGYVPPAETDVAYCGEGIELYADDDGAYAAPPDYDRPGSMQLIVAAPATDAPVTSGLRYHIAANGVWDSGLLMVRTPTGYALEALVDAAALDRSSWELAALAQVGIDISINVSSPAASGDCGTRLGQFFLRVSGNPNRCDGAPFCDVEAFCNPTLSAP